MAMLRLMPGILDLNYTRVLSRYGMCVRDVIYVEQMATRYLKRIILWQLTL